jgi:FG-GAP-like repeat
MDRRTFNKLFAGTVTATGISRVSGANAGPPQQKRREVASIGSASLWDTSVVPPSGGSNSWEFIVLDSVPPHLTELDGTAAADIDGDGKTELIISGDGALLWYRPSTTEKGVIALGHFSVGVALEDIDRDGRKEVVSGRKKPGGAQEWVLFWYKFGMNLHESWTEHVLDPETTGYPHDLVFGDLDGDGQRELVANALHGNQPGLFLYKIPANPKNLWKKEVVQVGHTAEGTEMGDLDGDGKDEIVSGPNWYSAPQAGAFSRQPWKLHALAPGFRELCRVSIIDVNGDGHLDVVLVEDEYPDGRLAWFENRLKTDPHNPWMEHSIDAPFNFAHSLSACHDPRAKEVHIFVGEMNEGGWAAPYNWDARLLEYTARDGGKSWHSELIYQGEGTHEAVRVDLDGSGNHVIFGHSCQVIAKTGPYTGWVQMFRPLKRPSVLAQYKHVYVDRDKPYTGIDIHANDVDGDGRLDIVCGAWWYKNPTWERQVIPGVAQIINAYDLDKDGKKELIGIKPKPGAKDFYGALCSDLVWLKPIDLSKGLWEEHSIGTGDGDWPHGNTIGPLLPGGRMALVCGYHRHTQNPPQIFEVPKDPKKHPWKKRVVADIPYGEGMIACDLDGDGKLDIVAGPYWLENLGDGRFEPHLLIDPDYLKSVELELNMISRIAIADVNGDGRPDILFTVEDVDYHVRKAYWAPVGWLENTGDLRNRKFDVHIIDRIRSPHSIGVGDLDGDGELVVVVGEHDPFRPYRSECRLYAYKKADAKGLVWSRHPIDNRFSHHVGAKVVELTPGKPSIISHSWMEPAYVHIWERDKILYSMNDRAKEKRER